MLAASLDSSFGRNAFAVEDQKRHMDIVHWRWLAAFRANVTWDVRQGKFEWKVPLKKLVPAVIDDLVGVCVTEHRDNNLQPDKVGKRESTYVQCYDKLELYPLESGLD